MSAAETRPRDLTPERFRNYLLFLARRHLGDSPPADLDPSDLVQEALLEAHRKRDQFRGRTEAEMAGWLRQMLAFGLRDALRTRHRARRDAARARSLEAALDQSSARLGALLADSQTSPSQAVARGERAVALAEALAGLPEPQRRALVLRHFDGRSLAEISRCMDRTPAAVAGLLKRGTQQLRDLLRDRG